MFMFDSIFGELWFFSLFELFIRNGERSLLTFYEWIWIIAIIIHSSRTLNRFCSQPPTHYSKWKFLNPISPIYYCNDWVWLLFDCVLTFVYFLPAIYCTWNVMIFEHCSIWILRVQYFSVSILTKLLKIKVFTEKLREIEFEKCLYFVY